MDKRTGDDEEDMKTPRENWLEYEKAEHMTLICQ
jgi:hypothetical protein